MDGTIPDDIVEQSRVAWQNLEAQLKAAGMTLDNLVKITTILPNQGDLAAAREVRSKVLGDRKPALRSVAAKVSLAGKDAGRISCRPMRATPSGALLIRSSDSDALDFDLPRRVGEPTDDEGARLGRIVLSLSHRCHILAQAGLARWSFRPRFSAKYCAA
jgi:hypothetical protein